MEYRQLQCSVERGRSGANLLCRRVTTATIQSPTIHSTTPYNLPLYTTLYHTISHYTLHYTYNLPLYTTLYHTISHYTLHHTISHYTLDKTIQTPTAAVFPRNLRTSDGIIKFGHNRTVQTFTARIKTRRGRPL